MGRSLRRLLGELPESGPTLEVLKTIGGMISVDDTHTNDLGVLITRLTGQSEPGVVAGLAQSAERLFERDRARFEAALALYRLADGHDRAIAVRRAGGLSGLVGWLAPKTNAAQALDAGLKWAVEVLSFAVLRGMPVEEAPRACAESLTSYAHADALRLGAWVVIDGLLPLGAYFMAASERIILETSTAQLAQNSFFGALSPHLPFDGLEEKRAFIAQALKEARAVVTAFARERSLSQKAAAAALRGHVEVGGQGVDALSSALDAATDVFGHTGVLSVATRVVQEAWQQRFTIHGEVRASPHIILQPLVEACRIIGGEVVWLDDGMLERRFEGGVNGSFRTGGGREWHFDSGVQCSDGLAPDPIYNRPGNPHTPSLGMRLPRGLRFDVRGEGLKGALTEIASVLLDNGLPRSGEETWPLPSGRTISIKFDDKGWSAQLSPDPTQPEAPPAPAFEAVIGQVRQMVEQRQIEEALIALKALLKSNPERVEVYECWRDLHLIGDDKKAVDWALQKIISLDPSPTHQRNRGIFLGRSGRYQEARAVQEALWAQRAGLSDEEAQWAAQDLLVTLSRVEGAPGMAEVAEQAIARFGNDSRLLYQQIYAHFLQEDYDEALAFSERALSLVRGSDPVHASLVQLHKGIMARVAAPLDAVQKELDELCKLAHSVHGGRNMDANNRLWAAFYDLDQIFIMVYPPQLADAGSPVRLSFDGQPWFMAFTSKDRLHAFARARGLSDVRGQGAAMSLSADASRAWFRREGDGVFGVRVNQGETGWFSPLRNLDPIYNYLVKHGALTSKTPPSPEPVDEDSDLERLRYLMHEAPSEDAWWEVVQVIDDIDRTRRQVAIEYCLGHMEDWPAKLRRPSFSWSLRVWTGEAEPRFALVKSLDLAHWIKGWMAHHGVSPRDLNEMGPGESLDEDLARLADSPWLAKLSHLHAWKPSSHHCRELLLSERLSGVEALHLDSRQEDLEALPEARFLSGLHTLVIDYYGKNNPASGEALERVIRTLSPTELRVLEIEGLSWTQALSEHIAAQPCLPKLEALGFRSAYPDRDTFEALITPALFTSLKSLDLTYNLIDSPEREGGPRRPTLALLTEAMEKPGLEELRLAHNSIDDEGAARLAACPGLADLRHLNLSNNPIGDEGLMALARSPYLRKLETIVVRQIKANSTEAFEAVVKSGNLPMLRRLVSGHQFIDDGQLYRIASARGLDLSALGDLHEE